MIEAVTIDYNRVQSSTATEGGERIVVTLEADAGPANISLPSSEAARLMTVLTATGMAVAAYKRLPRYYGASCPEVRDPSPCEEH